MAVIQEAYVHGVSTCAMEDLVQAMGGTGVSKSQVSRSCEELDERVDAFLTRPIEGDWPYEDAQAESFMKTLKVENVYLMEYWTFADVAEGVPRFIGAYNNRRLHSALGYLSPATFEDHNARSLVKTAA